MKVIGEWARWRRKVASAAPTEGGGSTAIARRASSIRGSLAFGSTAALPSAVPVPEDSSDSAAITPVRRASSQRG